MLKVDCERESIQFNYFHIQFFSADKDVIYGKKNNFISSHYRKVQWNIKVLFKLNLPKVGEYILKLDQL